MYFSKHVPDFNRKGLFKNYHYLDTGGAGGTGIPHSIVLCFTALHRHCVFYKLKVFGNAASSKAISAIVPTAFAHFMSLSHFGNSHSISNFFIIIISIMVICDQ